MSQPIDETTATARLAGDPLARPLVDFVLPGLLLALLTGVFLLLPIDLVVERWFYAAEQGGWFLKDAAPLQFIYKKGLLPALVVVGGAVVLLVVGFRVGSLRRYRKVAIYLLLVMVIAPGLLVNALMKEGWGRPRPRQVEEFGGNEAYERLWEYDGSSYGKSFPSGHAAMGFYLFSLYFLMRREGRGAALLWLSLACGLGALLGITRMVQGGHFPSDVVWSAGVCYFVAAGLYYGMGLHRELWYAGGKMSRSAVFACVAALLGISVLAVGTPYHEEKRFTVAAARWQGAERVRLELELPRANLRVARGDEFVVEAEAEGFGAPGSRLEDQIDEIGDAGSGEVGLRLSQERSGFFATVEQPMTVTLPRGLPADGKVTLRRGLMVLDLSGVALAAAAGGVAGSWELDLGEVDFTLLVPEGMEIKVELADGVEVAAQIGIDGLDWDAGKRRWKRGEHPAVKVRVKRFAGGGFAIRAVPGAAQ